MPRLSRRPFRSIAALIALAVTASACADSTNALPTPPSPVPAPKDAPNVVIVVTDDQRYDTLWAMPQTQRLLVNKGVRFTNSFVVNPLCCPSRASILTGDYSHNTGVWTNGGRRGGFEAFVDTDTLATRLQAGGYHTGLIGKYLNHYDDPNYEPPGWSSWQPFLAESEGKYYDYVINDNGKPIHYGLGTQDYSTDVVMRLGHDFIKETPEGQPLFLYLAPKAPHGFATPAARDLKTLSPNRIHFNASWNEHDISDKPRYIHENKSLKKQAQTRMEDGLLQAYRALGAVDDGIAQLVSTLESTGRLDNTLFIFLSDNGTAWGEHRWSAKSVPYEETIRVPIVMRYDQIDTGGRIAEAMALNIDLAPTILELAGIPASDMDGESLVPILEHPSAPGRSSFLIEHYQLMRPGGARDDAIPSYCGIRTHTQKFIIYATGERELYQVKTDPAELHNTFGEPGTAQDSKALQARVSHMCVPRPPGFPTDVLPAPPKPSAATPTSPPGA